MNVELTLGFIRQFGARYSSFTVRRSLLVVHSSSFVVRRAELVARCSELVARQAGVATRSITNTSITSPTFRSLNRSNAMPHSKPDFTSDTSSLNRRSDEILPS